ncbi:unnamed protein product [Rhizoctonia solani]|uniref:Uncharacterized protein n=1 Tax=Rhizoctonia solani TaxID=456999 RepID=A0A8H3D8K4_9AGAM|nr:unnamed protein product [Rhizoctonia solani]
MKNIFAVSIAALFAVLVHALPAPEPAPAVFARQQKCIPLGLPCNRLPPVQGPRCCTFLVCDWDRQFCKSGVSTARDE